MSFVSSLINDLNVLLNVWSIKLMFFAKTIEWQFLREFLEFCAMYLPVFAWTAIGLLIFQGMFFGIFRLGFLSWYREMRRVKRRQFTDLKELRRLVEVTDEMTTLSKRHEMFPAFLIKSLAEYNHALDQHLRTFPLDKEDDS